jgi:hypothetical protein
MIRIELPGTVILAMLDQVGRIIVDVSGMMFMGW